MDEAWARCLAAEPIKKNRTAFATLFVTQVVLVRKKRKIGLIFIVDNRNSNKGWVPFVGVIATKCLHVDLSA